MIRLLILATLIFLSGFAETGDNALSQNITQGIPVRVIADWKIVLPKEAIGSEEYAAKELQKFFRQATGILLSITNEPKNSGVGHIYIGPSKAMRT